MPDQSKAAFPFDEHDEVATVVVASDYVAPQ